MRLIEEEAIKQNYLRAIEAPILCTELNANEFRRGSDQQLDHKLDLVQVEKSQD